MKNLIFITVILLFATTSMFAQYETGYVHVQWNDQNVTTCCDTMQTGVSYGVLRISDYTMVSSGYVILSTSTHDYTFQFTFPCAYEGEDFRVFAEVQEGCDPNHICGFQKEDGIDVDCSELMGTVQVPMLYLY